jgi:hypothetical protein
MSLSPNCKKMVRSYLRDRAQLIALCLLAIIFFISYGVPTEIVYPSHDFLDSTFVIIKARAAVQHFFLNLDAQVEGLVGGVPLSGLGISDFNLGYNLYLLMDPFSAFAVNEVVARGVGFVGIYLLLTRYVLAEVPHAEIVAAGTGILFALMPYYERSGTITLQPLFFYALINLCQNRSRLLSYFIILLFPFYSRFFLGGFAVIAMIFVAWLWAVTLRKPYATRLLIVGIVVAAVNIAVEFRSIYLVFFTDFRSHRLDWNPNFNWYPNRTFGYTFLRLFLENVIFGQFHNHSGQFPVPLVATILAGVLALTKWIDQRRRLEPIDSESERVQKRLYHLLGAIVAATLGISLFNGAEESGLTTLWFLFPIPVQVSRINVLHPVAWQLIFAISIAVLILQFPRQGFVVAASFAGLALVQGLSTSLSLRPRVINIVSPIAQHLFCGVPGLDFTCKPRHVTTIAEYYRQNTYAELARQIGRAKTEYFVVSYDIDPMIAVFNGFKALDGYVENYPLKYKREFRNIIARELDDDSVAKTNFDEWGNQVYLFGKSRPDGEIRIDFCAARGMGAEYVITPLWLRGGELLKLVANVEGLHAYAINPKVCESGVARPPVKSVDSVVSRD